MCGIIVVSKSSSIDKSTMNHRGPDQYSEEVYKELRVGYFRLAITGGVEGNPPVTSRVGNWQVFLNGEIYNYKKLMSSYSLPETESDSQVLADGLEKIGIGFIKNLKGMFAGFAISLKDGRIYCFRDPIGEKPLFYTQANGVLEFASEVKALASNTRIEKRINSKAVMSFLQFGYVEEPDTIYSDIKSVGRGCIFEISNSATELNLIGVIDPSSYVENNMPLRDLVLEIVEEQFSYSGKSSLLLSSGVDSSLLFKLGRHFNKGVRPIVHGQLLDFREREWILASNYSVMNLQVPIMDLKCKGVSKNELIETINAFDQPHSDSASPAYYSMLKKLKNLGLKVVYGGHGPDEYFWGYDYLVEQLRKIQSSKEIPDRLFWDTSANSSDLTVHLRKEFTNARNYKLNIQDFYLSSGNITQKMLAEVTHSYLNHNGLRQIDRLAMHHSIEPRTPFADSRIYGWAQANQKNTSEKSNKQIFREFAAEFIGEKLSSKAKKGFSTSALWDFKSLNLADPSDLELLYDLDMPWISKPSYADLGTRTKYRLFVLATWVKENV